MRVALLIALAGCGFNGSGTAVSDGTAGGSDSGSGSGAGSGSGSGSSDAGTADAREPDATLPLDAPNGCNFAQFSLTAEVDVLAGGLQTSSDGKKDFTGRTPKLEFPATLKATGPTAGTCAEIDLKHASDHTTVRCRFIPDTAGYAFDGCYGGAACPTSNGAQSNDAPGAKVDIEEVVTVHLTVPGGLLAAVTATANFAQCDDGQ